MTATRLQMAPIARRFKDAAHPELRLLCERDSVHRYGRYLWAFREKRLRGRDKAPARNRGVPWMTRTSRTYRRVGESKIGPKILR